MTLMTGKFILVELISLVNCYNFSMSNDLTQTRFFLIDCMIFMIALFFWSIFLSPFLDVKLWNSLLIECFPLIYDLNGFKSRINRHLFYLQVLLKQISCMLSSLCISFSCNYMPRSGCSALHGVNANYIYI